MKTRALVDTGFWVALFDAKDERHQAAADAWKRAGDAWTPITTQHIMDETMTYLNCSLRDHAKATAFHERMRDSGIPVFSATETLRDLALDIFFRFTLEQFPHPLRGCPARERGEASLPRLPSTGAGIFRGS